jgi:hypothetical protein
MELLEVKGKQNFMGIEIPIIEGGFGENYRCLLAKDIAEIHGVRTNDINDLINNNIDEFEFGIDILDLCNKNFKTDAIGLGFITSNRQKYCYLLSEQGYMLLVGFMKTEKAKEIRKKIRREYFQMKESIKEIGTIEEFHKDLLNKMEYDKKTIIKKNDNQINDIINVVQNLVNTVTSLTNQNTILMNKNNELLERMLDMKEEKEIGYNDKIMETVSFEDDVEKEINSFQNVTMKLQDFCDFINSKGTVEKKLGIQLVNQLLRDNGIYDKYNNPIEEDNNYFVKDNQRYLITKYGMIMLYRLIKEQITFRYSVRR